MSVKCNNGSNCQNVCNAYTNTKANISAKYNALSTDLTDISRNIMELKNGVPNDYLGEKVLTKLGNIAQKINSNLGDVSSSKSSVNSFINKRVKVHSEHYKDYLERERRERRERERRQNQNL